VRALIALGGNALAAPEESASPEHQLAAATQAMTGVAEVVAQGAEVLLTHGNGPQVGDLLVKNETAASVVPPEPLDSCVAQTQGTLGFLLVTVLERALAAHGVQRQVAALVTRALVDRDDPGFTEPTKPIGRYLPEDEAKALIEHGQTWEPRGSEGWRRVVASPEPLEILDAPAAAALVGAGFVVVSNGGGGISVVREPDGSLHGVEAVIDKDLGAAVLAKTVGADVLVIATDVPNAWLDFRSAQQRPIEQVSVGQLREYAEQGHFFHGSMAPKVDAVCRFVESGGQRAVITDLDHIAAAVEGRAGTVVHP
jgi:carbamate kinase